MDVNNKEYKIKNIYNGDTYRIKLLLTKYQSNDSLAIQMLYWDEEFGGAWMPYDMLTTNLVDARVPADDKNAYVKDDWVEWIEDNNIGKYTGVFDTSGWNTYYLIEFNV